MLRVPPNIAAASAMVRAAAITLTSRALCGLSSPAFASSAAGASNGAANISFGNYGLGAGVWTRSANTAYRAGRGIKAGRVWTNCYHLYPAHAAFGGYKESGIGRENHAMMLDHYQQTKNLLVSYSTKAMGLF